MKQLFTWILLAALIANPASAATFSQLPLGGSVNSSTDQLVAVRSGTSTTSNTIGVGVQTFTTQSGLGFVSGQAVSVVSTANSSNYMQGNVASYSGSTLVVNVLSASGSGTYSAWTINGNFQVAPLSPSNFLQSSNNLSDLSNSSLARINLGLGTSATYNVASFLQAANNLSDLANVATARANLGLGSAALLSSSGVLQPINNLSDVASTTAALTNLLPSQTGQAGKVLGTNGTVQSWVSVGGSGTVTTTGSPVSGNLAQFSGASAITAGNLLGDCTTNGTLAITCTKTNGANFAASATTDTTNAGNISSGTLPAARLPSPTGSSLGGTQSIAAVAHNFLTSISTLGVPTQAQPAASDVSGLAPSATTDTTNASNITSGTLASARLPNPSASSLGGVQSTTGATNNFLTSISTLGIPAFAQPTFGNLSGNISTSQVNGGTGASSSSFFRGDNTWSAAFALTTTGTSGAATFSGGTLNVPQYATPPAGSSGQIQINNGGSFGAIAGLGMFNVLDYGASCNGQTLSNVTTTSSSATVSSGTYTFTSADVGKAVSISGGGNNAPTGTTSNGSATLTSISAYTGITVGDYIFGAGIPSGARVMVINSGTNIIMTASATASHASEPLTFSHILNTSISSVSGGNAVLAATAGTSLSGTAIMTFGTPDDVGINAAVTAASNAGGGLVKFPPSMCVPTAVINVPNNVSFVGEGWSKSVVKPIYASDQTDGVFAGVNNSFTASTCTAVVAAGQSNNKFSDFEIDDSLATASTFQGAAKGIRVQCATNSIVDHMYVHDTPATSVATDFAFNTQVTNSLIINPGRFGSGNPGCNGIGDGLLQAGGDSYLFANNTIVNPTNYGAFLESESTTTSNARATITGNIVVGGPMSGTGTPSNLRPAGLGNSGGANVVFSGNTVNGSNIQSSSKWGGIATDGGTVVLSSGIQSTVTGNNVDHAYFGIDINYNAVAPSGSQKANTVISGNHIDSSTGYGILLFPRSTGGAALDGIVIGNNIVTASQLCGIGIIGSTGTLAVNDLSLTGNILANNGASGSGGYTQSGVCATNVTVTGFRMIGNAVYDNASGNQKYAIGVNTGASITGALIHDNDFTGVATSAFDALGTISGYVYGNKGVVATMSGCSATSLLGADVGSYASGTSGSCPVTVTPNGSANITAPNGWACSASDVTTPADAQTQSSSTNSSCTISGTTVSGDTVIFQARPF